MILHIRAVEAKDLPKMDVVGKSDPFLSFQLNQSPEQIKTSFKKQTFEPVWNEEFHIPFTPGQDNVLHVELFDMDKVSDDDLISNRDFEIKNFKLGEVVDNWYDFFKGPKADKPGKVHLVFHVAEPEDEPFVPKPHEEAEPEPAAVQEKEITLPSQPEPEPEPEPEQEPEPEPEQNNEEESHKEPQLEEPQEEEPQHQEEENKQNEENNQPQVLNEIKLDQVQSREVNPILEEPQPSQEQPKPAQEEPAETITLQTRSAVQSQPAKTFNEETVEPPYDETKCKMILLVIILTELFILFLKSKF